MQFIFPVYPFSKNVDEEFLNEYNYCKSNGINTALIDLEQKKIIKKDSDEDFSLFRGWFLSEEEYLFLENSFKMKTSFAEYSFFQDIRNWYPVIKESTFKTNIFNSLDEIKPFSQKHILKNFTKSLGIVSSVEDIKDVLKKEKQNNFNGLVLREFEELKPTERRYFIYNKKPLFLHMYLPVVVIKAIYIINSNCLYTIDVAENVDGTERIVEIGDGQVCSFKENNFEHFFKFLNFTEKGRL